MAKVKVKIVKYDMDKTKKRSRKNILVDDKNEESIITQLEKIHKGEKVVTIHEIQWDEDYIKKSIQKEVAKIRKLKTGEVKFFNKEKGFGFIAPDDEQIEDLFFHASAVLEDDLRDFDIVEFEISKSPKGPCAIHIKLLDDGEE